MHHDSHCDEARRQHQPLAQRGITDVTHHQAVDEHLSDRHGTGDADLAADQVDTDPVLGQHN